MGGPLGFDTCKFRKKISEVSDSDYGDFMRAANIYLSDLRDVLHALYDDDIDERLDQMQQYLQFYPNWDVDSTRVHLEADANYVDDLLQGHAQDWESAWPTLDH